MKNFKNSQRMVFKEKGSVLIISLVLLTAITLISITSLQRTSLQTRIVANLQHSEVAFHKASGELDETFDTYTKNSTAANVLIKTKDQFTIDSGEITYTPNSNTGVDSSYQAAAQNDPHQVQISSNIRYTGQLPFSKGNSEGSFSTHLIEVRAIASQPGSGRVLSSQSIGIKLSAPAQN